MLKPMCVLFVAAGASFVTLLSGCRVAPDSHAADVQAIRDSEAAWEKAFATRVPEKAEAFYADDADSMLPDTPLMAGKQAILAGMKPELGDPNFSLIFSPAKVEIARSGDIAYSQGRFKYTTTDPKTGRVVGQEGSYVEVYKKQADGTWKVEEDIATEETPLKPLKNEK